MRNILIKSNVYSYIIIKNFFLKPMEEGVLLDDGLYISEYRSLKNLVDTKKIIISEEDYLYILDKLKVETPGSEPSTPVDAYTKDEVNNLLETKLNVNGVAVSAYIITPGKSISITGAATSEPVLFDGSSDVNINITGIDGSKINTGTIPVNRIPVLNQNTTGNAATATKLQTGRTINNIIFDGTKNITIEDPTKLALSGGFVYGAVSLGVPLSLASGGTGASNTKDALYNLGVVKASALTDGLLSKEDKIKLDSLNNIVITKLTQEEYDLLTPEQKNLPFVLYVIVE